MMDEVFYYYLYAQEGTDVHPALWRMNAQALASREVNKCMPIPVGFYCEMEEREEADRRWQSSDSLK